MEYTICILVSFDHIEKERSVF